MTYGIYIFFGVLGVLFSLNAWLMLRNHRVGRFRDELIDRVSEAARANLHDGEKSWRWRYDTFGSVSYERMLYQFWKPLRPNVWWKDTSFLDASRDSPAR